MMDLAWWVVAWIDAIACSWSVKRERMRSTGRERGAVDQRQRPRQRTKQRGREHERRQRRGQTQPTLLNANAPHLPPTHNKHRAESSRRQQQDTTRRQISGETDTHCERESVSPSHLIVVVVNPVLTFLLISIIRCV